MIAIFLVVVGLIGITWAFNIARSTFKAGPGSWAGFRETWKFLKRERFPLYRRLPISFRAIPPSRQVRYGVRITRDTVGGLRPMDAVEKSESDQAGIQNEANAS